MRNYIRLMASPSQRCTNQELCTRASLTKDRFVRHQLADDVLLFS
jgi:hypothetical protein